MSNLSMAFLAAMVAASLSGVVVAQEPAAEGAEADSMEQEPEAAEGAEPAAEGEEEEEAAVGADITCAEFVELEKEGRTQAMEALAVEIGMNQEEADEETEGMHLADMEQYCEAEPDMPAMEAFQNALDNPG